MARNKKQVDEEHRKKMASKRAKRYYERQKQRGKVRVVRWIYPDEKRFLDEFIFPDIAMLTKKWKSQQEK